MKKIFALVSLAALAGVSSSAMADGNVGGEATINFTAGFTCTTSTNPFNANITLANDILDSNGVVKPNQSIPNLIPGSNKITCTGAGAKLSAKTANGGLTLGGLPNPSVARIGYVVHIDWAGKVVVLTANGNPGAKSVSTPTDQNAEDVVTGGGYTIGGSAALPQGVYKDILTVQVGDPL